LYRESYMIGFVVLGLIFCWWVLEKVLARFRLNCHGKAVFITGCDTGFGRLAVKRFYSMGFKVFANFLQQENVESLKKELATETTPSTSSKAEFHPLVFDVTDEKEVIAASEEVKKLLPDGEGLWGIINNAGISQGYFLEVTEIQNFRNVLNVNFIAMVAVTKYFLPLVRQAKGRIVNVTSLAGVIQCPGMSAYSASKHAAEAFSDAIRVELQPFGVKVSMIEPGFMRTNIVVSGPAHAKTLVDKSPETAALYRKKFGEGFGQFPEWSRIAHDPALVINAFVEALTAQFPKPRYMVGPATRFICLLYRFVPSRILDILGRFTITAFRSRK